MHILIKSLNLLQVMSLVSAVLYENGWKGCNPHDAIYTTMQSARRCNPHDDAIRTTMQSIRTMQSTAMPSILLFRWENNALAPGARSGGRSGEMNQSHRQKSRPQSPQRKSGVEPAPRPSRSRPFHDQNRSEKGKLLRPTDETLSRPFPLRIISLIPLTLRNPHLRNLPSPLFSSYTKMSDRRDTQDKPLIILRNAEDYPTWKSHAISRLQQQSCDWAITGRPQPNLESVRATLIEDRFAPADLRPSTLVSALRDEKKDHLIALTKSAGLIKELVDKSLHPLLNNKTAAEMWTLLEDRFQHISPMSVTRIFADALTTKLSDCKDIMEYTSRYQIAFDKILSLLNKDSWMSKKTIEMALQGSLLRHLGKDYSALVSAIETTWKEETTDLQDTILRIIRHAEINKGNDQDTTENTTNAMAVNAQRERAPQGTCTTQECVDRGSTAHFIERCWVLHPELRPKYPLRSMRLRGSNRSLKKTAAAAAAEATPEIDSWQPKILAVEGPWNNCWLVDSAADVHVCNDKSLMTEYKEQPTNVGGSTSNGISPGRGKVRLRLSLQDNSEGLILNLRNVYYLPNSPCNLVSLGLLNDSGIYHSNERETLYHVDSKRVLAQAQRWRNSYLLKPLNLSDGAVHLLKINNNDYQWLPHALRSVAEPATTSLSTWHKRLGHPNFSSLKAYLNRLYIPYTDDSSGYICDSCLRAKATKTYCRDPQKRSERPYQFIHTDLVGPINPVGFSDERYFFTFTDDATRMTDTYTGTKKSDWLKCLKAYHSLCRTRSKNDHPIERLRSDYGSELQSHKADKWMEKEGITFEPSAPYSQE